jgi:invasion protein IalB
MRIVLGGCMCSGCGVDVKPVQSALNKLNVNTTTVTYTATKDNPPVFISLF